MDRVNNNPWAARVSFQWKYIADHYAKYELPVDSPPEVLNIGCASDPIEMGDLAYHFDMDDWSYLHKWFKQGDAHELPFPDKSFKLVIMGDIHEHLVDPLKATLEAARVVAPGGALIMTIFEEWRLPGVGQWIEESHRIAEEENFKLGYFGHEDYQAKNYPQRIGVSNTEKPHLHHINQFTDDQVKAMVVTVINKMPEFRLELWIKAYEATHEGHDIHNWLIALRRMP